MSARFFIGQPGASNALMASAARRGGLYTPPADRRVLEFDAELAAIDLPQHVAHDRARISGSASRIGRSLTLATRRRTGCCPDHHSELLSYGRHKAIRSPR